MIIRTAIIDETDDIVSVCAWCPKEAKEKAEREALEKGKKISHGICEECEKVQFATLDVLENEA
jgi:hypothetical protein